MWSFLNQMAISLLLPPFLSGVRWIFFWSLACLHCCENCAYWVSYPQSNRDQFPFIYSEVTIFHCLKTWHPFLWLDDVSRNHTREKCLRPCTMLVGFTKCLLYYEAGWIVICKTPRFLPSFSVTELFSMQNVTICGHKLTQIASPFFPSYSLGIFSPAFGYAPHRSFLLHQCLGIYLLLLKLSSWVTHDSPWLHCHSSSFMTYVYAHLLNQFNYPLLKAMEFIGPPVYT